MRIVIGRAPVSHSSLNQLTFNLDFCMSVGHDHRSPGTESQGHRSRSRVRVSKDAVMTSRQFLFWFPLSTYAQMSLSLFRCLMAHTFGNGWRA